MSLKMEGQLADVTVLFADIRGFTTMSSHMPAEDVVKFLNAFFAEAVDAVERHGGIVDKFIGDCVMGMWGAPVPKPEDARNAINAALEIAQRARTILVNGKPLEVGVGVNSGNCVVGAIGSKNRLDYTAIGSVVNLSARLCGIADAGATIITADTLMRAGPGVVTDAGEPVILKGIDAPIVPHTVLSVAPMARPSAPIRLDRVMVTAAAPKPSRSR
jgi:adenylate cyclase